ncbi:MAG: chorismate mutase [Alphaproteobacteria bacterium]|nr:chorismate mutase [Alphaproteobacteria bacterium]
MATKTAATASDKQALADLRSQIDQIDGVIHDMLRERSEVIDEVRKIKGKQQIYIRPGREAQMMRVLMGRPQGKIPEGLVVRIWREMISAFTLLEGNTKVGVYAPEKGLGLWDVARDHYGAFTPLVEYKTVAAAIKALRENKITIAVIPPPVQGEKDSWWSLLAADKSNVLTVFQSVPSEILKAGRANARNVLPMGLVIGKLYPELTGDDRSYLALQCTHVPEAEMKRLLSKAGYKVRQLLVQPMGRSASSITAFMAEVDGFVGRSDTRLGRLRAMMGSRLQLLSPLGGYPVPLKNGRR